MANQEQLPLLEVRGLRKWFPMSKGFFGRKTVFVKAVDGVDIDVLPGETLWSLARRYCTTVQAIMLANRLWDYMIYAGQLLIIPAPSQPAGPTQPLIHTVSSGETLFSIAQRYHTTVAAIMQANHLDDTLIYPGQLLIIPASN